MRSDGAEDAELWAAVGEPSRRRLLDVLLAHGEATPTLLAESLPFSRQAVTKHLAVLDRVGLVRACRVGREVRYSVEADRIVAVADVMAALAVRWRARLGAIKEAAEATHSGRGSEAPRERGDGPDPDTYTPAVRRQEGDERQRAE